MVAVLQKHRDLVRLIDSNLEIPTIPVVAANALRAMKDESTNAHRLALVLQDDPGLTARILKVANSVLYALPREIKSLAQAATVLGFDALKGLVLVAACRGIYRYYGHRERSLWIHSVGTACAAQQIADAGGIEADEAFVAGLMHDIGRVVMNNSAPEKVEIVETLVDREDHELLVAERQVFGYTHSDVGGLLVSRWGLPQALEQAVSLHHDVELVERVAAGYKELVYITHLANGIAHAAAALVIPEAGNLEPRYQYFAVELGLNEEAITQIIARTKDRIANCPD